VVVEVTSPSTARIDRGEKLDAYRSTAGQDSGATVCRRESSREGAPPCGSASGARTVRVARCGDSTRELECSEAARPPWAESSHRVGRRWPPRQPLWVPERGRGPGAGARATTYGV